MFVEAELFILYFVVLYLFSRLHLNANTLQLCLLVGVGVMNEEIVGGGFHSSCRPTSADWNDIKL